MKNKKLSSAVAILVVAVWATSMIADMIPQLHYDPPVAIYPALMLALGYIFGFRVVKGIDNEGVKGDE